MRFPPQKMAVLPTVDDFPSFAETVLFLRKEALQCIWHLPNKSRYCMIKIPAADNATELQLAESILKSGSLTASTLENLLHIAEMCCCPRHHRNKIWGSPLRQQLANQWYAEIKLAFGVSTLEPIVKLEEAIRPVMFADHHVHQDETLLSNLQSDIYPWQKPGFVYFFSYAEEVFGGMVKIGYTSRAIESRLYEWVECGHGSPILLGSFGIVPNAERVELLIHFELLEFWREQRWCNTHKTAHIEWFKIDLATATTIAELWCQWMRDANPYDRRGKLKSIWRAHIEFLVEYENPITAAAMMQIHEIEEGSEKVYDFIDDEVLRERASKAVKKEEEDT